MITDEVIKKAAEEAAIMINTALPESCQCNHQFSQKFENKMRRLIHKTKHPIFYNVLKCAASILLIIIIGTTFMLSVNVEVRASVLGWIKQKYENIYEYLFEGKVEDDIETGKYIMNWIPEDYKFVTSFEIANGETYIYSNEQGMILQFSYSGGTDAMSVFPESDGYATSEIMIKDISADLYIAADERDTNGIVWEDTSQKVLFWISAYVGSEDLIKIAENIEEK